MALSAASVVNRVRLVETLFHVFDLDSDGKITREEIGKMLHTLVDVTHSNRKHRHPHSIQPDQTKESDLQRRIDDAFNELNGNDDDHITKDEFIDWYMKSGLLSATTSNEISVRDTSRLQQLGRRSRKVNKQRLENGKKSEALSHMLERRPKTSSDDDEAVEVTDQAPVERATAESDDADSHTSKENERWQHLFNSVFEKIRAQRLHDQQPHKVNGTDEGNDFHAWKCEGEEKLKREYFRQKSNDEQLYSLASNSTALSHERSTSPETVTVRL